MTFDTPTLFASAMIVAFAGSAILPVFLLLWQTRDRASVQGLLLTSAGFFLAGSGAILLGARGTISDSLSLVAANALLISGTGLRRCGLAAFLGRRPLIWLMALMPAVWVALINYPPFAEQFLLRVYFVQTCLVLSCFSIFWMSVFANREKLHTVRLLGFVSLIEIAGYFWFVINQHMHHLPDYLASYSSDFFVISLFSALLSMALTVVLNVCMVVERHMHGFRELSRMDELTNLPNRRAFIDDAEAALAGPKAFEHKYSLIVFDMDALKSVNERYSHAMGDALLQLFSRILRDNLSGEAICGRIGGEKFAVFLSDCDREFALLTAQRICRRFKVDCREATGGRLAATVSVGMVTANCDTVFARAMEAAVNGLCKAKRQGKAQIVTMDLCSDGLLKRSTAAAFSSLRRKAA
ncbi:diguanylate cyclase [Roseibium sp.]|uniref:GGDEF domain-containing protein n=2 Tax=Roseibium sp. TaxID=1936156 RepID=UPI003D0EF0E6